MSFTTKDSGVRETFSTGAKRDTGEKHNFAEVPPAVLAAVQAAATGRDIVIDVCSPIPDLNSVNPEELRYDLIPQLALDRLAALYGRGAKKYDDNNWLKGMPIDRVAASLLRHVYAMLWGDTGEDHAAAAIWNVIAFMVYEAGVQSGVYPKELVGRFGLFGKIHKALQDFDSEELADHLHIRKV